MNETQPQQPKPVAPKPVGDRQPIPIEKLLFSAGPNVASVKLPSGPEGKSERICPFLNSGVDGDVKTEIEHRPWMRVFRVTRTKRVTRSGIGKDAKEVVSWEPLGKTFHVPDVWAVSVPVDE